MSDALPLLKEDHISQVPALQLLQNLGYTYLSPEEAIGGRGGCVSRDILEGILVEKLRAIGRIRFKRQSSTFSQRNIQSAIQKRQDILASLASKAWDMPMRDEDASEIVLTEQSTASSDHKPAGAAE